MTTRTVLTPEQPRSTVAVAPRWRRVLPGLVACGLASVLAFVAAPVLALSPLVVTLVAGAVLTNTVHAPASWAPGQAFAARHLLRAGIVLLGLQVAVGDVVSLGWPVLVVVATTVAVTFSATVWLGRLLGVRRPLAVLIAAGFSICGAAAVAAVDGVNDSDDEDVMTAIALVATFGTAMIVAIPGLAAVLGMEQDQAAVWAGASIHEVAQVVAAGGMIGAAVLTTAVTAKLARVLLLAPVVLAVGARRPRPAADAEPTRRPPLLPAFVVGFLALAALRSTGTLPPGVVTVGGHAQTLLLAAAMFAVGSGVDVRRLRRTGARPFVLAALSTGIVTSVSLAGVLLAF